ncbi:hypothetical protein HY311_01170 [Candidatus Nomurabacteria bacterium]|nr:hypothetical protein [Candidatus Nomurabacteria bacterium]
MYTKQSILNFLTRTRQHEEVQEDVRRRMEVIAKGKNNFPEGDIYYVLENPILVRAFLEWVAESYLLSVSAREAERQAEAWHEAFAYKYAIT